jgi:hypothetical protein
MGVSGILATHLHEMLYQPFYQKLVGVQEKKMGYVKKGGEVMWTYKLGGCVYV